MIAITKSSLRVASLLPSATEILCSIGGTSLLVGRSHEDNYPLEITGIVSIFQILILFSTKIRVYIQT